ncbi:MAG: ATP-binding cassette domain-containing protein [Betaproteobacteria bacterium]|nr:ATP-binding cassette domain-containing protein [Betaproteobacteria bacterium]
MDSPRILPLAVTNLGMSVQGIDILRGVSFAMDSGSRTVILGPNGAGKSVLLRLLHGLLVPSAGRVEWSSADTTRVRRAQAFVFQRPVMLRRSAADNIAFALRVAGAAHPDEDAQRALAEAGLAHLAARPARLCSGGEQQRIALARAGALAPEVLFLDEPAANLDPAATRAIEERLMALHAGGITLVMTTHDLAAARRLATRVLFLHQGRLMEDSPAEAFFSQPRSPEAAAFLRGELLC